VFADGPLLEAKEYSSGFWPIEALDIEVALKRAAEKSKCGNRKVEV
jgi:hypothetical protein